MASLSNFTVPLVGGANGGQLLMPKLKYRFRATFTGFGAGSSTTELTKQVVTIKRPSVKFEPITLDVYNSKIYLQGKPAWEETTITLRDDITGAVSAVVGQQLQKQFDFMEQSSAASGIDYKFLLSFDMLDGGNASTTPTVLETWELDGCFLTGVDYGEMDYKSNDPAEISMTIRFDNAIQTSTNGAVNPIGVGGSITTGTFASGAGTSVQGA
jgi:hypothetical protein